MVRNFIQMRTAGTYGTIFAMKNIVEVAHGLAMFSNVGPDAQSTYDS